MIPLPPREPGDLRPGETCYVFTECAPGRPIDGLPVERCTVCGQPGTPKGDGSGDMVHHAHKTGPVMMALDWCKGGAMDVADPSDAQAARELHAVAYTIADLAIHSSAQILPDLFYLINTVLESPVYAAVRMGVLAQALLLVPVIMTGKYDPDHPPMFFAQEAR